MPKKKRKLQIRENVIVFPGTVEKLMKDGQAYLEGFQYDLAAEAFEEALRYVDEDEHLLGVYGYALYETRQYEKSKIALEKALALGPERYIEMMELFIMVLMELREFKEVEMTISSLLEEQQIPNDQIARFQQLQALNAKLADEPEVVNPDVQPIDAGRYQVDAFKGLSFSEQYALLQALNEHNIIALQEDLIDIVEETSIHPTIQSFSLLLLAEQQVHHPVTLHKFDQPLTVNPNMLAYPTSMPIATQVLKLIEEELDQNPSGQAMAKELIERHSLVSYPYEWLHFHPGEIAKGYTQYIEHLFSDEMNDPSEIFRFIQELEIGSEVPES